MNDSGMDLQYPESLNIAARLADGALDAGWGERPAFFYRDREISYAEAADAAARWGGIVFSLSTLSNSACQCLSSRFVIFPGYVVLLLLMLLY